MSAAEEREQPLQRELGRLQEAVEASRRDAAAQMSVFEENAVSKRQAQVSAAIQEAEKRGQEAVQGIEAALQAKQAESEVAGYPAYSHSLLSSKYKFVWLLVDLSKALSDHDVCQKVLELNQDMSIENF